MHSKELCLQGMRNLKRFFPSQRKEKFHVEHFGFFKDISASSLSAAPSSSIRQATTITESATTPSQLDYHNFVNDGEFIASMSKQFHSGEIDLDNDVGEDDFHGNPLDRGPYFDISASKNITAIAGHSAYLNCRVRNLGNRTVSENFPMRFLGDKRKENSSDRMKVAQRVPSASRQCINIYD